jgi:RimJ/RimL family protein N-acetyltransferase
METLKTLRRWSGVIKRRVLGLCEIKAGIMLSRPVGVATAEARPVSDAVPEIRSTREYREGLPWSEAEFLRRTNAGNVLYELFIEGQPVCYGWVAEAGARVGVLHDLHLVVPERGFYVWDCATSPAFRGKGYFLALLTGINRGAYPSATLALVAVDTGNGASRRVLARAGFRPMFSYVSARLAKRPLFNLALCDGRLGAAQREFDRLEHLA